jgi:SAM-dependent methyltransferase
MRELVAAYPWPSQAFWRYFELRELRALRVERPILEIGCGDGRFSALVFDEIDEAIDINPKSIARARARTGHLYKSLRCADARDLKPTAGGFSTVYANCVMEHIPDFEGVLGGCFRALRPGGQLIMTVPLAEMNRHLALPFRSYARWRQRQLVHHNLLSREQWEGVLRRAGFTAVEFTPYLGAQACKFWDRIDGVGCFGWSRYSVANMVQLLAGTLLPQAAADGLGTRIAKWLERKLPKDDDLSCACATVIRASK